MIGCYVKETGSVCHNCLLGSRITDSGEKLPVVTKCSGRPGELVICLFIHTYAVSLTDFPNHWYSLAIRSHLGFERGVIVRGFDKSAMLVHPLVRDTISVEW